jgi:acetyl esterase/lipase
MDKTKPQRITVETPEPIFYMDEEVTYAQADAWFGHVTRDIRMNIIYPQTEERLYPCILWVCGGGWLQVNKGAHTPYLAYLARRGFVVASVDYRLGHEAPFPGALADIKAAIRYLRAHAPRYAIDPARFGIMGESAGGYLTAMAALTGQAEFEQGRYLEQSSAVQAACPWYMPTEIAALGRQRGIKPLFFAGDGNDEAYGRYINPLTYVTPQAPPFLLLHGTHDTTVPLEHGEMMYKALLASGADAQLVIVENAGHADRHFYQKPIWEIISGFFKEKLTGRPV